MLAMMTVAGMPSRAAAYATALRVVASEEQ